MPTQSTTQRYGSVAMIFHWLVAILILFEIPLGLIANRIPLTPENLGLVYRLFSLHKTLGVLIFATALLRILWAISQPRPRPLHPDRRIETFLAATTHWLLYGTLVAMPITGWIDHAASTGFAPILLPIGQSLPFVPKDPELSDFFAALHRNIGKLFILAVLLHISGALKHAFFDRDATLRRMLPGYVDLPELPGVSRNLAPALTALAILAAAISVSLTISPTQAPRPIDQGAIEELSANWTVAEGDLSIFVTQFGAEIGGRFADWTATIEFDPERPGPMKGTIDVRITTGSLAFGDITDRVIGSDFLDAAQFPQARYSGSIITDGDGYRTEGTLSLREQTHPVPLIFMLKINEGRAEMTGMAEIDRRDFDIGTNFLDETVVGYLVTVRIRLTARPAGG